jgi:acyl carrier protein
MSVRATILDEIARVAQEQKKALQPLTDDAPLLTIGLDSLCFAILVARLEEKLGTDPFGASDEVALPVTVGDLVRFYEHALV